MWLKYLMRSPIGQQIEAYTKKYTFLGFKGIPIYDVIRSFRSEVKQDMMLVRAGALTFNFMLSIFPTIIFLFTLLPYIPIKNFDAWLLNTLDAVLPKNAYLFLESTIKDIIQKPRSGLLSTGFLFAIFFASNGIMSLQRAFDKAGYHQDFKSRKPLERRLLAIALVFVLSFLLFLTFFLIIGGTILSNYLDNYALISWASIFLVKLLTWGLLLFLSFTTYAIIYKYVPSVHHKFGFFSAGAGIAVVMSMLTSVGFSYFVDNFGAYNKLYGTVGTIIVLMIWFNLNALVLLFGFEVNVAIHTINSRKIRKRKQDAEDETLQQDIN